jgi:hypothetical protein
VLNLKAITFRIRWLAPKLSECTCFLSFISAFSQDKLRKPGYASLWGFEEIEVSLRFVGKSQRISSLRKPAKELIRISHSQARLTAARFSFHAVGDDKDNNTILRSCVLLIVEQHLISGNLHSLDHRQ